MSWAWMAPLVVAGVGAWVCAMLAASVRRETARVRQARVELSAAEPRLRRADGPTGAGTHGSVTGGSATQGSGTHGSATHGSATHGFGS
jgi:hypothetical protein